MRIEETILSNLLVNDDFAKKVTPFLKLDYFAATSERYVLEEILKYQSDYYKIPNKDALKVELANRIDISQTDLTLATDLVSNMSVEENDTDWLVDKTEQFCKDRAIYNALQESVYIMNDDSKPADSIPGILSDALAVSFDSHVGHDYIEDVESRYEFYHRVEEKIPFDLSIFNKITKGGLPKKTLTCVISGPGGGKSLFMCHHSAAVLNQGKNVLYITMEMSEERIAERIDSNLFNVPTSDIKNMSKETFLGKIDKIKNKTRGKLIIKEYPTGNAHAGHFRALLRELKIKKGFTPDLVVIDYLNIASSSRVKMTGGTYSYIKSIAEEFRALAIEFNIPILTATQSNRDGIGASDLEMTNTSESLGLPFALDCFFGLIRTEELDSLNQIMVKQLKNRYNDLNYYKRFVIGVDFARMKLYDVEQNAQEDIVGAKPEPDVPLFDKSTKPRFDDFNF